MIYPIVVYGHPVLRKVSTDIDKNDPEGPFIVSDIIFYQHRLRRFREKPNFTREKKTFINFIE